MDLFGTPTTNRLRLRRLLTSTILSAAFISAHSADGPYKEDSEAWPVTSAWVKELPAKQQAVALTLGLAALNRKATSLLEHRQDGEQAKWVSKIQGCGYSMLSTVATKTPEYQSYLQRYSDAYVQLVRGKITWSGFAEKDRALRIEGDTLSRSLDEDAFQAVRSQYKKRVEATELSLVVYAMLCAK